MSEFHDGSLFGPGQPCFGCAPDPPADFRLKLAPEGDAVVTRFIPTERRMSVAKPAIGAARSTVRRSGRSPGDRARAKAPSAPGW